MAVVSGTYAADVLEVHNVFLVVSTGFMFAALIQATMMSQKVSKSKTD